LKSKQRVGKRRFLTVTVETVTFSTVPSAESELLPVLPETLYDSITLLKIVQKFRFVSFYSLNI